MFKMLGLNMNNRGSITVEMSFIMPIVFGILIMCIHMFLVGKESGEKQMNEYTGIYLYDDEIRYGEVADRLRRWQLYGNVFSE